MHDLHQFYFIKILASDCPDTPKSYTTTNIKNRLSKDNNNFK